MEHLNHARNCAHDAEAALRENQERLYFGALHDLAALHATIAQAEALTRIAEAAETLLDAHSPDTKQVISDLEQQLTQAQSEYAWTDHENDRLRAENDKLRSRVAELEARRLGETVENGEGESWGDDLRAARKQVQEWAEAERRRLGIA